MWRYNVQRARGGFGGYCDRNVKIRLFMLHFTRDVVLGSGDSLQGGLWGYSQHSRPLEAFDLHVQQVLMYQETYRVLQI